MSDTKSSRRRKYSSSSDGSVDSAENERRKDLKERDEFASRLKKKDEGQTRKVTEVNIATSIDLSNIKIAIYLIVSICLGIG